MWKKGRVMISYENVGKDIEHGGLKITNIEYLSKALKITWIRRLYTSQGSWLARFGKKNYIKGVGLCTDLGIRSHIITGI